MKHPRWEPGRIWEGEDVYVIGGGSSLHTFDWNLLRGCNTIGCNSAFILGAVVSICIFADVGWWDRIGCKRLAEFGGLVVASNPSFDEIDLPPWVLVMDREDVHEGLYTDRLGFNGNTGALAINLALRLGAKRVFLLGFDMRLGTAGQANWHDVRYEKANPEVYTVFSERLGSVARDVPKKFPGCEVVNVSDVSELTVFRKESIAEHFTRKKVKS